MPNTHTVDLDPADLQAALKDRPCRLIDVREPHEWEQDHIDGAELMPLSRFSEHMHNLMPDESIILYCKMGGRSMQALRILQDAGYRHLQNLTGGITAYRALPPNPPSH